MTAETLTAALARVRHLDACAVAIGWPPASPEEIARAARLMARDMAAAKTATA